MVAGTRHDGQGGQAEEVHLEHLEFFEDAHFELGNGLDGRLLGIAGGTVQAAGTRKAVYLK